MLAAAVAPAGDGNPPRLAAGAVREAGRIIGEYQRPRSPGAAKGGPGRLMEGEARRRGMERLTSVESPGGAGREPVGRGRFPLQ